MEQAVANERARNYGSAAVVNLMLDPPGREPDGL